MTGPGAPVAALAPLGERAGGDFWRRFRRSRNACLGGALVVLVAGAALGAPWLAPYDYGDTDLLAVWAEPSRAHVLGGDALGRDVLSRLIVGARVSLLIAVSVLGADADGRHAGGHGRRVLRRVDRHGCSCAGPTSSSPSPS